MRHLKLIAALAALLLLQGLLVPKYMESAREGALIGEYYPNACGHDVIFIGDCEVYENFSPVTLWNDWGIPAWIRGSAQQTIWQSYYLMEETLRYETPKVMVFNVLSMQYGTPESTGPAAQREAYNRMTLDTMAWSSSKVGAIRASMTREERKVGGLLTYLFPLLRYHDRWSQLTPEDLTYWLRRDTVSHNGYLMQTGTKPYTTPYVQPPLADYAFSDTCWTYLERMTALCREHGVQLVLIKAPSLSPVWWEPWDAQIRDYADANGLVYLNLLEHTEEMGIDWARDTYDAGLHLNVTGAEKASRWLGQQLRELCQLPDRRGQRDYDSLWAEKTRRYDLAKGDTNHETP